MLTRAIHGIRRDTGEAYLCGRHHAIDLSEGDLWLGTGSSAFDWNARSL